MYESAKGSEAKKSCSDIGSGFFFAGWRSWVQHAIDSEIRKSVHSGVCVYESHKSCDLRSNSRSEANLEARQKRVGGPRNENGSDQQTRWEIGLVIIWLVSRVPANKMLLCRIGRSRRVGSPGGVLPLAICPSWRGRHPGGPRWSWLLGSDPLFIAE